VPNPSPITIPCPAQYWPQQSPVDLAEAVRAKFPKKYLRLNYPSIAAGQFKKDPPPDDHGFNLIITSTPQPSLTFDGHTCRLKKIHFHARSEHRNGSDDFPLEIHLVHELDEPDLGSANLVLGVFVDDSRAKTTSKSFAAINTFLASPEMKAKIAKLMNREAVSTDAEPATGEEIEFDPNHLLPRNRRKFFRYEGSLTTAPFIEAVSWIVFRNPIKVLAGDVEEIKKQANHSARPTQCLARRFVLRSF
jgi:carbonic anhydrase